MEKVKKLIAESIERMDNAIKEGATPCRKDIAQLPIDVYVEDNQKHSLRDVALSVDGNELYTGVDCLLADEELMTSELADTIRGSYRLLVA